jgi:hypothetical protein
MALETLKGVEEVKGEKIVHMDDLRVKFPEKFNDSGSMDYKWFESEIRPHNFIYVRHDVNSLSFTIQNGPIKEVGKNGCQVTDIIEVAKLIIEKLDEKYPSHFNAETIKHLGLALQHQAARTIDREAINVEGTSNK